MRPEETWSGWRQGPQGSQGPLAPGLTVLSGKVTDVGAGSLCWRRIFIQSCRLLMRAVIFFLLLQTFVVRSYRIPSCSMVDTFEPGDYVLVEKISYLSRGPAAGDVIFFRRKGALGDDYVKRCVALPFERVLHKGKQLFVNSRLIDERAYASYREWQPYCGGRDGRYWGPVTLGADSYVVMGDNRDNSCDSRHWGPIHGRDIIGRAWMIYWPPDRIGFVEHLPRKVFER